MSRLESQVTFAQAVEGGPVRSDDIGIEQFGCGDQPGVVLTESPCGPPLNQRTPPCLCQVKALDRESLKRRKRDGLIHSALEDLFDGHDRDDQRPPTQGGKESPRRAHRSGRGLAFQCDEKRGIEEDRAAHRSR